MDFNYITNANTKCKSALFKKNVNLEEETFRNYSNNNNFSSLSKTINLNANLIVKDEKSVSRDSRREDLNPLNKQNYKEEEISLTKSRNISQNSKRAALLAPIGKKKTIKKYQSYNNRVNFKSKLLNSEKKFSEDKYNYEKNSAFNNIKTPSLNSKSNISIKSVKSNININKEILNQTQKENDQEKIDVVNTLTPNLVNNIKNKKSLNSTNSHNVCNINLSNSNNNNFVNIYNQPTLSNKHKSDLVELHKISSLSFKKHDGYFNSNNINKTTEKTNNLLVFNSFGHISEKFNDSDIKPGIEHKMSNQIKFIHEENDKKIKRLITSNLSKLVMRIGSSDNSDGPKDENNSSSKVLPLITMNHKLSCIHENPYINKRKKNLITNKSLTKTIIGVEKKFNAENRKFNIYEEEIKNNYNNHNYSHFNNINASNNLHLNKNKKNVSFGYTNIADFSANIFHKKKSKLIHDREHQGLNNNSNNNNLELLNWQGKRNYNAFFKKTSINNSNNRISQKSFVNNKGDVNFENGKDITLFPLSNQSTLSKKNSSILKKKIRPDLFKLENIENQEKIVANNKSPRINVSDNTSLLANNNELRTKNTLEKDMNDKIKDTEEYKFKNNDHNEPNDKIIFLKTLVRFDSNKMHLDTEKENEIDNEELEIYKFRFISKRKKVYDSLSEDEEKKRYTPNKFYLSPNSKVKIILDFLNLFIVIYSLFYLPLKLIYYTNFSISRFTIELIFDIFMLVDFFFGFFTAYFDFEENFISSFESTLLNYIRTFFIIDLIAAIPLNSILEFSEYSAIQNESRSKRLEETHFFNTQLLKENFLNFGHAGVYYNFLIFENFGRSKKVLKILRAFKAFKVFSRNEFLNMAMDSFIADFSLLRTNLKLFSYYFYFFIISHILSCLFIFLGTVAYPNWIVKANLEDFSFGNLYLTSLYFNHTTIFTVGYGDIISQTVYERTYNILLMIVGIMLYSFALTSISNIIKMNDEKRKDYEKKKNYLNHISTKYIINKNLYDKLSRHLFHQMKFDKSNKMEFLNELPITLRNEMILNMHRKIIKSLNFFKGCYDNDFIIQARNK